MSTAEIWNFLIFYPFLPSLGSLEFVPYHASTDDVL
jgi:hypothetical protein